MANNYSSLSRISRALVLSSYTSLLLLFSISTLVIPSCERSPNVAVWGLHVLPLLLFLPGVLKQNVRSHVWLSFILLGYFMASVSTAFACTSVLMVLEVVGIVMLFISSMMYIRWRSRDIQQSTE